MSDKQLAVVIQQLTLSKQYPALRLVLIQQGEVVSTSKELSLGAWSAVPLLARWHDLPL
jgi:hypothetical protein